MKSFNDFLKETTAQPRSDDEKRFKDKHVVDKKEHPVADESQFTSDKKKAKRAADHQPGEDETVYEEADEEVSSKGSDGARMIECPDCGEKYKKGDDHECNLDEEMTDAQMKKREEIVKSLKKKMSEFKDKYGDRAQDVMYATATKMAMKEEAELEEADTHKTKDGRTAKKGLYYYINKKKKEGRKANPKGHPDRPTEDDFKAAAKTAKEEVEIEEGRMKGGMIKDAETMSKAAFIKKHGKENLDTWKNVNEEAEVISEGVIDDLRKIVKTKSRGSVKFADGDKLPVDMFTASAMVKVHDALNNANKKKFADAINKNENMFMKMMDFAMSKVG